MPFSSPRIARSEPGAGGPQLGAVSGPDAPTADLDAIIAAARDLDFQALAMDRAGNVGGSVRLSREAGELRARTEKLAAQRRLDRKLGRGAIVRSAPLGTDLTEIAR